MGIATMTALKLFARRSWKCVILQYGTHSIMIHFHDSVREHEFMLHFIVLRKLTAARYGGVMRRNLRRADIMTNI